MTFDTTQILICVIIAIVALDAIRDIVRDLRMWRLIETLAGGQRAQTFPLPPVVTVPPVVPPVIPPVVVPPVEPPPVKPPVDPQKPPIPPVPPPPVGHSKILRGKCSWFGGPNDKGVKPDEGLALVERSDFGHGNWGGIFLPTQPEGTTGLARALDPGANYIACRWDYTETSKKYLQSIKVTVKNPANGNTEQARPVDWGPNANTGRVADLSPGLMAKLGLTTDGVVEVDIPLPGAAPAQPDTPTQPPPPITGGTVLQKQVWPKQSQAMEFFGSPGSNLVHVTCPWELTVEGTKTHTITIHQKAAESLTRILNFIWEQCGKSQEKINEFGYNIFDGSYNDRNIRGGTSLSQHAWGAAMDWNAAANPQHAPLSKTKFKEDSLIVQAFKAEGWTWGGDWSPASIDAMHVQLLGV